LTFFRGECIIEDKDTKEKKVFFKRRFSMRTKAVILWCVILSASYSLQASWTEPVLLHELNDSVNQTVAYHPRLTGDSTRIYFNRATLPGTYFLWEATLDQTTNLYSTQRIVSELGVKGDGIPSFWVSPDGLHIYYTEAIFLAGKYQRPIRFGTRLSLSQPFTFSKNYLELHKELIEYAVTLTADEKNVLWISGPLSGAYKIYEASRIGINDSFGNIREHQEFSGFTIRDFNLSSDGLTLYFSSFVNNKYEIWKAYRSSIGGTFETFENLNQFNQYGTTTFTPVASVDQKSIWYFQRQGNVVDLSKTGIYFSQWFETPFEKAVRCLTEARDIKIDVLEEMKTADQKEKEALIALSEMLKKGLPEGLTKRDIQKVRMDILYALCKQAIAERDIKKSLKELEKSITILDPNALD
jgi:hypothetical protein